MSAGAEAPSTAPRYGQLKLYYLWFSIFSPPALVSRVTRAASGQEANPESPGYPSVPVTMATCPHCPPSQVQYHFPPKFRTSEWEGPPLLDQSISAPPSVPNGETEAQGRRVGGWGNMLVKSLPLNLSLSPSLLPPTSVPLGWSRRSKSLIA